MAAPNHVGRNVAAAGRRQTVGMEATDGSAVVEALHRSTRHGERPLHPERLLAFQALDASNRPAPFKSYPGVRPEPLPPELRASSTPASEVLSGMGPEPSASPAPPGEDLLGTLLFLAAGVTRFARTVDGGRVWFRAAMSAGNLHPNEIYVVGRDVHHYDPLGHALVPLRRDVGACEGVGLVLTGIPFRTGWKYGERGWRHLWWDAGALLANLLAVADAHGLPAQVDAGFPDRAVSELVGIDGVDEMPLALVRLGPGEWRLPPAGSLDPVTVEAEPIAPNVLRFPLVVEAQAETALDAESVEPWQAAGQAVSGRAPGAVEPPGDRVTAAQAVEDVILSRGSTRLFQQEAGPPDLLGWGLPAAARAVPLDVAPAGTLLEHLVNVHETPPGAPVAAPGAYRFTASAGFGDHLASTDARSDGAQLCLDQPLGGDSVYTVFQAADLGTLMRTLGGRAYRAAHLEAGVVAGRLSLNAVALGAGATGLTFYDGAVSRHFATEAEPLLAAAVGIPSTAPAPSGTPGHPAELRGYGRVMTRLAGRLRSRRS